jgi:hypothetical protein
MKEVEHVPTVREAAAKINELIKSGSLSIEDLDNVEKLKAMALDPEAAKYWKEYYGEADAVSKQFGTDLTKELVQKRAAQDAEDYRIRLRRAVDMALDMQDKGLISQGRDAMNRQVDDIMKFDNQAFEAFKRALARTTAVSAKTAAKFEPALQVCLRETVETPNLPDQLTRMWGSKRK